MGDFLYVSVTKEHSVIQQEAYWWPLIFEAMHRANFQFPQRGNNERQGVFFSAREMDQITCSFEELWDKIYVENDKGTILFWFGCPEWDSFNIEVSIDRIVDGGWEIVLSIADGYLDSQNIKLNRVRINALLQAGFALFDLCSPSNFRMHWDEEHNGMDLLQIRHVEFDKPLTPFIFSGRELQWRKKISIRDHHIFIADPMPVHIWGGNYIFVSLFSK